MNHFKKFIAPALFIALVLGLASCATTPPEEPKPVINSANLESVNQIYLRTANFPEDISGFEWTIEPAMEIASIEKEDYKIYINTAEEFQVGVEYSISFLETITLENPEGEPTIIENSGSKDIKSDDLQELIFNDMYSDKPLGFHMEDGQSVFRLFVPRGKTVLLHIFDDPADEVAEQVVEMVADENMVFEAFIDGTLWGKYYGYQITERLNEWTPIKPDVPSDTIFSDPYGKATVTNNIFPQAGRTLILDTSGYVWGQDSPTGLNISDAIILEAHVRDLTAHPTAESQNPGTFTGLINAQRGGLAYLKELGVNAIEFLPIQEIGNIEAPFKESSHGFRNTWNAYAQNYWGYMTYNYFSPDTYYGTDGTLDPAVWTGTDGRVVNELKDTVKALHAEGIAVLMDVVYNHSSLYDQNPLKIIDYDFYFRQPDGTGLGELESRRRMYRRMMLDSLKYWMTEYHIDGFRFDLAASHDVETVQAIYDELKAINPEVMLIAEPWGGSGLSSAGDFLDIGWSKWDASIRDAVRGTNRPTREGAAWALGNTGNAEQIGSNWVGSSQGEPHQFVAYIESHDDTTLGDNLRIQSGTYSLTDENGDPNRIYDLVEYHRLTPQLLDAHRVAATALMLSQGPVMIHLGQEWARGKVTPDLSDQMEELFKGSLGASSDYVIFNMMTPNSYSADNETNWINYDLMEVNRDLFDFYAGWIELRRSTPLLGKADIEQVDLLVPDNSNALGVAIHGEIYGFVNSSPEDTATFTIPEGEYSIVVNKEQAGTQELGVMNGGTIEVGTASSLVLIKK